MLHPRRRAHLLVLAALTATVLVALALPELRLAPGMPLPSVLHGAFLIPEGDATDTQALSVSRAALLALAAGCGLVLLVVLWRALRGVRLRTLGGPLLTGLLVVPATAGAILLIGLFGSPGATGAMALPPPPPPAARAPLGRPPSLLLWITAAGLVLASAAAASILLRPRRHGPGLLLDALGREAERARAAVAAGADAGEVILVCYARMTAALAEERGIDRPAPMTAREFGERLGAMGLPRAPVGELTALFEGIRYGRRGSSPEEQARALACLAAILECCRAGGLAETT